MIGKGGSSNLTAFILLKEVFNWLVKGKRDFMGVKYIWNCYCDSTLT